MGARPIVLVVLTTVLAGCADDPGLEDRLAPEFGVLLVSTSTSGDAPDTDGYGLGVDGGAAVTLAPPAGTVTGGGAQFGVVYRFANPANRPFVLTQPNPVFPDTRRELRASSSAPGRPMGASVVVDHLGR
jgi:hypothetical protein